MSNIKDYLLILLMVAVAFCLYGLPDFYVPDESRYSEVAREMLFNKDYIVPYLNGVVCFFKPPLIYWITTFFLSVFGDNTWAARLVNPFLLGFSLLVTYYAVKSILESRVIAMLSVIVTMTMVVVIITGRYLNMDIGLAVFLNLTLLCYWLSLKHEDNRLKSVFWLILAFVFSGFAVMTKGFMGIIFPVAIIGLYSVVMQDWKRLFDIRLYLGLIVVLVITSLWIVAVDDRYSGFTYYYVMVEQVLRYATDAQDRDVSIFFFILVFMLAFFPWISFLPQVLKKFLSKKSFQKRKEYRFEWFIFIWAAFMFIFFAISKSFLPGYLAPIALPLGILIAIHLKGLLEKGFAKSDKISVLTSTVVFALFPIAAIVIVCLPIVRIYVWSVAALLLPIAVAGAIIPFVIINGLKEQKAKKVFTCFAVAMIIFSNFGYGVGSYLNDRNVRVFGEEVGQLINKYPNLEVYTSDRFYEIGFYSKRIPKIVSNGFHPPYLPYFKDTLGAKKYIISYGDLITNWNTSNDLQLLVVKNSSLESYKKDIDKNKFFVLDSKNYASLVANKDIYI